MTDFLTVEERSTLMARVKNKGTSAEKYVRKMLWGAKFRYRLNVRKLPGTPDITLPRFRVVVLVQGCFWHGHNCRKGQRRPVANREFWDRKLDGNIARDVANQSKLQEMGWTVFIVWECRLQDDTYTLLEYLNRLRREE